MNEFATRGRDGKMCRLPPQVGNDLVVAGVDLLHDCLLLLEQQLNIGRPLRLISCRVLYALDQRLLLKARRCQSLHDFIQSPQTLLLVIHVLFLAQRLRHLRLLGIRTCGAVHLDGFLLVLVNFVDAQRCLGSHVYFSV